MQLRCHLYVVEADQIEPMKSDAALVLGKGILAGKPSCHLENSTESLEELLWDGSGESMEFFRGRGVLLGQESTDPRLLTPMDVQSLNERLRLLTETELFRRCQQLAIQAAGVEALQLLETSWEEETEEDNAEGLWSGDWTIDQAEEYEILAQEVEKLRSFIAETARQGWGVVITGS